jgi:hypothetical protein
MSAYRIHVRTEVHVTTGKTDMSVHVRPAMRVYIANRTWPCAIRVCVIIICLNI